MSQTAHDSLTEAYAPDHWRTAWALCTQGASLTLLSRYAEAEPLLLESYEELRGNTGARPVHVATARQYLVDLYTTWDRPQDAARYAADGDSSP